ncbi:hypothetical protein [Paraburkholderia ginsengiterrae]|uniref:hypothetical protein n=1 Tax=Paraburkholderia ginsengiterrae TaxID=1462993 RepID=UPI00104283B8|nr:hypothetical protein [Paraburkholderia ginsengiterrae]
MTENRRPPVELHRLIHALIQDGELVKRFRDTPDAVFSQFFVPREQVEMLKSDPQSAFRELGVHPNLQFKYLGLSGLLNLKPASIRPFLERDDTSWGK